MATLAATHYAEVYTRAMRGDPCHVLGLVPGSWPLQVAEWAREVDRSDLTVLAHCRGTTLDIGCGPGRMTRALAELGHHALGIDVVPEAVAMARLGGGLAIVRDVFDHLPGEGEWETALLADGNIGIGGDPRALLDRVARILAAGGRVVVDLAPAGAGLHTRSVRLRTPTLQSAPFRWAIVGADAIGSLAVATGFLVLGLHRRGARWFAVLEKSR